MAGPCAGGQLAQARPALREERAGARLVAVERRASASSLIYDVELDLGAGLLVVGEQRRGLQREVPQRVVESTVTHAARFRRRTGVSCRRAPTAWPSRALGELRRDWLAPGFGRRGCAIVHAEPLAPVAAHVLDQRRNRHALRRQRVLHTRRHLGVGVALDNALPLGGGEGKGGGPRADAGQRALELEEAATPLGKVANQKDR